MAALPAQIALASRLGLEQGCGWVNMDMFIINFSLRLRSMKAIETAGQVSNRN
jgi:hypothetical protein